MTASILGGAFPGHAFDGAMRPLTPDAQYFGETDLNSFSSRSMVAADSSCEVGLVWVLEPDARFKGIPPDHLILAAEAARHERAVLLFTTSPDAEESVRTGLLSLFDLLHAALGRVSKA